MSNNLDRRNVGIMTEQLEEQRNNFVLEVRAAKKLSTGCFRELGKVFR